MQVPEVSIIVCTYNRKDLLAQALSCMQAQQPGGPGPIEIIVVDDGSTDGTEALAQELAAASPVPLKYIRTEGKGVSHARNLGIKASQAEWVAFFDQDQLAGPDWLRHLWDAALASQSAMVDGPRDLALPPAKLSRLSATCRRILGERVGPLEGRHWNTREGPNTGNVLIHRTVFAAVGGFDESLLTGGEDLDFFMRAKTAGFTIGYAPEALVHHLIPPERLTAEFFRWNSLRCGINFAGMDHKYCGPGKTMASGLARLAQALLINTPLLIYRRWSGDEVEAFGVKCRLWRAWGYLRMCLFLFSPAWFAQQDFFGALEFRKEQRRVKGGTP